MVGEFQSHHYSLLVYVLNRVVGSQRDKYKFTDLVHLMVAQATRRYKQNHMSIEEMLTFAHEVRQAEVYSAELSHFMLNVLNDMLISIEDRHLVLLQNQFKNGKSYPSEVIDMMCMRLLTSSPSAITGADLAVLCMSIHDWDDVGQKVLVDLSPMVLKKAPKLGGQDAANVLYAYGRQGVFQEDIYRELCEQLCVVVDDLEIRHMQQISDAFQYFNYKHDALLECMARHTGTIVEAGAPEDYPEQIVQLFRYTVNCGCFVGRPELSLPVVRYMEMAVESATVEDLSHFTVSYGTVLRGVNGMNAYSEEMMKNIGEAILKLDKSALDPRDSANIVFGLGMLAPMTTGSINRVNQAARDFVHVFEDPAFMQELKAVPMGRFMAGFGAINFPFRVTSLNNCGDVILDNAIQTFTRHHLYQASTENLSLFLGGLANYGYVGFLERETVMDRIRKFHTQDTYQDINKGSQSSNQDLFALTPSRAVALLSAVCKLRLLATQDHDTIELKEAQRKAVVVLNAALLSSTELSMGDVASYAEAVGMLAINHPENTSHAGAVKSAWERVIMPKLRAHTRDGTCTPLSATENRQLWDGYLALKHLYPDAVKRFQTDDTEVVKGLKYTRTDEDVFQQGLGWNEASRGTTTNVLNKFLMYIAEALRQDGYGVVDTYTPYVHERTGYTLNATLLVDPSSVPTGDTASTNGKSRTRGKLKPVLVYIIMQPDTAYIQANEVVTQREPSTRMIGGVTSMRGSREATEVKMSVEPNGTVLMRDRLLGYNGVCVLGLNMRDLNELRQVQRVEFATKLIKVMVDAEAAA
ncbi:hypothetical protein SARC_12765 [Sphaeroforma arctica JP610]|uniref:Uncharacterized protein n=1 Tax=Sphaeroforma arctica JP610 TaxID=667725 RepID=A0A0L0FD77_9EUKA|nr:hypothetical protein SARC_12765 [Sphaeroforma arctica JP610]KNC74695.1 hypothetical protein SARC_12765 [Sphaeroforma arctica JP610]|eukprot:XP_014148597.1 hypothetical protein SARC_12765 [Sphaeroforma arctica JP610]